MGPVLVGIDGSPPSTAALRWAAWFAATTQRPLHAAYAWQHGRRLDPLLDPGERGAAAALEGAIEARLRAIVRQELGEAATTIEPSRASVPEGGSRLTPTEIECRALRGEVADALAKEAGRLQASLLVVGARGAGGALRAVLGSVCQRLTTCPAHAVAVVPDGAEVPTGTPWRIVVGVDGSDGASRALRWSAAAAAPGGGEIVAVHVLEPSVSDLSPREQESVTDEMRHRLEDEWCAPLRAAGVPFTPMIDRGVPAAVLTRIAQVVQPACVVAGSRGLGPISQRLLGSVTHRLVRELPWPTVVVPAPKDCAVWAP